MIRLWNFLVENDPAAAADAVIETAPGRRDRRLAQLGGSDSAQPERFAALHSTDPGLVRGLVSHRAARRS